MPYITKNRRFDAALSPETCGELNFAICNIIKQYLGENPNYQRYNDVGGALAYAQMEIYRRLVVPYEKQKEFENGDVF